MDKLALLKRIDTLSTLIHSKHLTTYGFEQDTIAELQTKLDELTQQYIVRYCA